MTSSLEQHWIQRARSLTQALIISGTLNIGLVATFVYFTLKEKQSTISYSPTEPPKEKKNHTFTNDQILRAYSHASFQDLLVRLENTDLAEDGYTKRDLALACLIAFHHLDIEKALGGIVLQKRCIAFRNIQGDEMLDVTVFPGLKNEHFQAVLTYAKTEKWPFTSKGLFFEIKRNRSPYDASLLEAFYLTSEFHSLYSLLQKNGFAIEKSDLLALLTEGSWEKCKTFADRLRVFQSYSIDACRDFLLAYLFDIRSKIAANWLFQHEMEYVVKRFDDQQLLVFLDLNMEKNAEMEKLAKELLLSPRSDLVRQRASSILYSLAHEIMPQPYEYTTVVKRFCPEVVAQPVAIQEPPTEAIFVQNTPKTKSHLTHRVQDGENLWKISRKYGVSIESIKKLNRLDTDRLKPGKELQIPETRI